MGQAPRSEVAYRTTDKQTPAQKVADIIRNLESTRTGLTLAPIELSAEEAPTAGEFLKKVVAHFDLNKQTFTSFGEEPFFILGNNEKKVSCRVFTENGKAFAQITVTPILQ